MPQSALSHAPIVVLDAEGLALVRHALARLAQGGASAVHRESLAAGAASLATAARAAGVPPERAIVALKAAWPSLAEEAGTERHESAALLEHAVTHLIRAYFGGT